MSEKEGGKGWIAGGGGGALQEQGSIFWELQFQFLPTTTPTDQNFYIAYTLKYNAQWAKTNTKNE